MIPRSKQTNSQFAKCYLAACVALMLAASPAAATIQDRVFEPSCVAKIDITAPPQSITNLYADPKGAYQPATMTFDVCGNGTEIYGPLNVTFRLKGNGSFRTLDGKAAFKVKMPSGNRIDGLKSLTLNNMVQDPSSMREALAYEAYRAIGVAAPRAGYAVVKLNGLDYGLHVNVETLDERFTAEHFPSTQHLYESPDWPLFPEKSQRDILPANVPNYQVEQGSTSSRSDLEALAGISQIFGPDEWWTAFQQKFNAEKVLRYWAAEAYLGDSDDFTNGVNNFYLQSNAAGVFEFLPWGRDHSLTLTRTLSPQLDDPSSASAVADRCFKYAPCFAAYRSQRAYVSETIIGLDLVSRARQIESAIKQSVSEDTRRPVDELAQCEAANADIGFLVTREMLWAAWYRGPNIASIQSSQPIACRPPEPDVPPATPELGHSVSINGGAHKTRSRRVSLSISWPSGVVAASVSNDAGFARSRAFAPSSTIKWTLAKPRGPRRIGKVYVRFLAEDGTLLAAAHDAIRVLPRR
ncbi:MAG: CotH kinase family protein [Solirubrobacterales bacterium]